MAKKKAPKRPKKSASLLTWEKYDARMKQYHKDISGIESGKRKKAALIKKHCN